jgi:hypothetical protein
MISAVRAEARTITRQWLRRNARQLRADLSGLSSVQAGVPYELMFTEIWHYLFGSVNAQLSATGFISDTYAEGAAWRGFVPFAWSSSLQLTE